MKRGTARSAGGKKSGGMPSSRASDAAERSPAVYFSNLKAERLLQKQMQVLKRAENSLVHRIVIDQKILFKRFQAKLRRSKIARARLWGDKDTERQLRARDLRVMNTNCGQEQDDFEFLKKLEYRPCLLDTPVQEEDEGRSDRKTSLVTDKDLEEFVRAVLDEQEPPPTEKNLQSLTSISHLLEEARLLPSLDPDSRPGEVRRSASKVRPTSKVAVRPVTTSALQPDRVKKAADAAVLPTSKMQATGREGCRVPLTSHTKSDLPAGGAAKSRPRPLTSPAWSQVQAKPKGASPVMPHQASSVSRRKSVQGNAILGTSSPGLRSRRPSQTAVSMFEEQTKVDVVALRLEEARNADFTPKVSAFIRTLLDLDRTERARSLGPEAPGESSEGAGEASGGDLHPDSEREEEKAEGKEELKGDRKFDYYATKMALHAACVKKAPPAGLPGTPEEVNMKLVGNQSIKSITMPKLHLYYDDQQEEGEEVDGENHRECGNHPDHSSPNILILDQEA